MMEGFRSLYDYTIGGLKIELLNEGIIKLDGIFIMSIINIISLIILVLSLKMLVDIHVNLVGMSVKI